MPRETVPSRRQGPLERSRRERGREPGWDAAVAELAERQHGVVCHRQLRDLGLERDGIQHRLASGRLHRLHRGTYAVGHRRVTRRGWWMAAVLASGPKAVLSHASAGALWGLRDTAGGAAHVIVADKSTSSRRIHRHVADLPADELTSWDAIPTTTVPRTILDLAATRSVEVVSAMLREAEYRRLHDRLSLWDLVARYPGRRGVRRVRTALELLVAEPAGTLRSRLEEDFAAFLRRRRLPHPRFNDWIVLGSKRFQVDCHWPGAGQVVELDGWRAHGTRSAFQADRARDRELHAAGYSVTRITWRQLRDEPEALAADLRALLARPTRAAPPFA